MSRLIASPAFGKHQFIKRSRLRKMLRKSSQSHFLHQFEKRIISALSRNLLCHSRPEIALLQLSSVQKIIRHTWQSLLTTVMLHCHNWACLARLVGTQFWQAERLVNNTIPAQPLASRFEAAEFQKTDLQCFRFSTCGALWTQALQRRKCEP